MQLTPLSQEYISGIGLIYLLKDYDDLVGAEVGVNRGVTTQALLESLRIKKLYVIDPWLPYDGPTAGTTHPNEAMANEHYEETLKRIEVFNDKVELMVMTSTEAANLIPDDSLDFCFIDANHSYESVKEDLNTYWPKVKYGSFFAGHDYSLGDVNKALMEFLNEHNVVRVKTGPNDIWFVNRSM